METQPDSISTPGVRRSSRKRSAPQVFVPQKPKMIERHWNNTEKNALLGLLRQLNNRELLPYGHYHRFPYNILRKRIGTKSMQQIKIYLTKLERKGAVSALTQIKQQPPIESWCQMADKLTVLTSDDSSRHLIRVIRVMALESIESHTEKRSTATKKGFTECAVPSTARSQTRSLVENFIPLPAVPKHDLEAAAESSRLEVEPTDSGMSSVQKEGVVTSSSTSSGKKSSRISKAAEVVLPTPDYESIYKYIAGLMQGEQKNLGGLESLVILDCLKTLEGHLKERDNSQQKIFVQQRFMDILQNLYLTIDNEDNTEAIRHENLTTADLIGSCSSQSQPGPHQASQSVESHSERPSGSCNQSVVTLIPEDQSASTSGQASQSPLQQIVTDISMAPEAASKQFKVIGLGSLNPFNIPVKLLEIRKDR